MNSLKIGSLVVAFGVSGTAFAQQPPAEPAVGTANDKTLIQRGEDFVPAQKDMKFQAGDRIVILNDGRMEVNCGGQKVAVYDVPGVFDVPGCPGAPVLAQTPPAQPPAQTTPAPAPSAPARTASTGGGGGSVGAVLGGLLLAAAAAGGGGGGGGGDGPSSP
jgi:hypothetical protein